MQNTQDTKDTKENLSLYKVIVLVLCAIVTISSLYIMQPIQPLLVDEFDISITQVTLFTSVVLFSLAIAPIFYGYLLEKFQLRIILFLSLMAMGTFQSLLMFSPNFEVFLTLRILEALALPAALTATLTAMMRLDSKNIQKYIAIYVASTIFGGVLSRVGGGILTTIFSWEVTFLVLGLSTLCLGFFVLRFLRDDSKIQSARITTKAILEVFKDKRYILLYSGAFIVLFCFQGSLNFLPFEIKVLEPEISSAKIGFLYLGYIIGIITALFAGKIAYFLGTQRAMVLGFVIFGVAPLIMLLHSFWWLFISVFVLCIGMFITHSLLSVLTNSLSTQKRGITNGLYLAFYYMGGSIGTTFPSYLYHHYGWGFLCVFMSIILFFGAFVFLRFKILFNG